MSPEKRNAGCQPLGDCEQSGTASLAVDDAQRRRLSAEEKTLRGRAHGLAARSTSPSPTLPPTSSIVWHMAKTDLRDQRWPLLLYWGLWLFKMIWPAWLLARLSDPAWKPPTESYSPTTLDENFLHAFVSNWWWPTTGLLLLLVITLATRFPSPLQAEGFWKKLPVTSGQRLGAKLAFLVIACCLVPLVMLGIALPLYSIGFDGWFVTMSTTAFWLTLATMGIFTVVIIFRSPFPTFLITLCEVLLAGLLIGSLSNAGIRDGTASLEGSRYFVRLALALAAMGSVWWLIYWKQAAWRANLICLISAVFIFLTHSFWPFDFLKMLPIPSAHGREFAHASSLRFTAKDARFAGRDTHDAVFRRFRITWSENERQWQHSPKGKPAYVQPIMTFAPQNLPGALLWTPRQLDVRIQNSLSSYSTHWAPSILPIDTLSAISQVSSDRRILRVQGDEVERLPPHHYWLPLSDPFLSRQNPFPPNGFNWEGSLQLDIHRPEIALETPIHKGTRASGDGLTLDLIEYEVLGVHVSFTLIIRQPLHQGNGFLDTISARYWTNPYRDFLYTLVNDRQQEAIVAAHQISQSICEFPIQISTLNLYARLHPDEWHSPKTSFSPVDKRQKKSLFKGEGYSEKYTEQTTAWLSDARLLVIQPKPAGWARIPINGKFETSP